jgi:microcin C transport system permease protein
MFEYTIRRILLMIPTGLGITFMVFFILQVAPDGPFERAVKQIKQANMGSGESGMSLSADVTGDSSELTPELLEKLRAQYGLDKPIVVRYLIWLGLYPKEAKSKIILLNKEFRESVDAIEFDAYKEYLLQKYVKVVLDENQNLQVIETGVGLEFNLPDISDYELKENFNHEKYNTFISNYKELPANENIIKTWYVSDWKIKKYNEDEKLVTLVKNQYKGILHGYLGYSEKKGKDVSALIKERLHISAFFGLTSLILGYLICIPLGIWKAIKNGSRFDVASSVIVFAGYSIPGYILGIVLLVYFGGDYFPLHGWRSPDFEELGLLGKIKDQLHHAFLPIICYMIGSFATLTVLMKNSLLENLSQDYVRTAFAKGLSERRVIFRHAVRNSLIPLATGIGGLIGVLLAGSYLLEKTFGIDGIGLLSFYALIDRDYDIMMGFLAISVFIRLTGNLISDLTYALVDPRIRFK